MLDLTEWVGTAIMDVEANKQKSFIFFSFWLNVVMTIVGRLVIYRHGSSSVDDELASHILATECENRFITY